ncbi:MAG: hypothetical protein RR318_03040, partial [Alistipes sp.]
ARNIIATSGNDSKDLNRVFISILVLMEKLILFPDSNMQCEKTVKSTISTSPFCGSGGVTRS